MEPNYSQTLLFNSPQERSLSFGISNKMLPVSFKDQREAHLKVLITCSSPLIISSHLSVMMMIIMIRQHVFLFLGSRRGLFLKALCCFFFGLLDYHHSLCCIYYILRQLFFAKLQFSVSQVLQRRDIALDR